MPLGLFVDNREEYYRVSNHYKRCRSRAASRVCSPRIAPSERCWHLIDFPLFDLVVLVS